MEGVIIFLQIENPPLLGGKNKDFTDNTIEMNDKKQSIEKNQNITSLISRFEISPIILTACELDIFAQIHSGTNTAE